MAKIENKDIPRKMVDSFNRRNWEQALEMISDNTRWTDIPSQRVFKGKTGYRQYDEAWLTAFPDGQVEIVDIVAENDRVVLEYVGRGTHTGPLQGPDGTLQPTGKNVELHLCDVIRVKDGVIIEGHTYYDVASMIRQLTEQRERQAA